MKPVVIRSLAVASTLLCAGSAMATPIVYGLYNLHNHPDGTERPPLYGLRLDELYNATSSHDVFTFNFDHAGSNMQLEYIHVSPTVSTIHIWGTAWGGRDTGNNADYANDLYRGFYTIDFNYLIGVGHVPGDDDVYDNPGTSYNYGSIQGPAGTGGTILLRDGHYSGSQLDFRLGDEDNDLGHRGFNGISGWGWLFTSTGANGAFVNYESNDWLFTASLAPTPGAAALMGLGALAINRRRR